MEKAQWLAAEWLTAIAMTLFAIAAAVNAYAEAAPERGKPVLERSAPNASPFVEFDPAPRAAAKPRFEMTVATPVSGFAHMRRGASNAVLECSIPANLRRD
jgi:hypothetical protein